MHSDGRDLCLIGSFRFVSGQIWIGRSAHGAGRVMSRTMAPQSFTWRTVKKLLAEGEVILRDINGI